MVPDGGKKWGTIINNTGEKISVTAGIIRSFLHLVWMSSYIVIGLIMFNKQSKYYEI